MQRKYLLLFLPLCLLLNACLTYYQKNIKFHKLFLHKKLAEADQLLAKDKQAERRNTRLLYYLNRGMTTHLMGQYEASNHFFEQAHLTHEDFQTSPVDEALAFLVNPTLTDYRGEDHEVLLIHYYKALNCLQLGKPQEALVECRRLNIKLHQLSDKHDAANKYRRDAFIHTLMGLVYQANHEYNDAFIAYRNAVEIYQEDYQPRFGIEVPTQLKKDLIYTAYKTGFDDQVQYYQQMFQLAYDPAQEDTGGDVVFLWNNGLGPVKSEWAINFVVLRGAGDIVTFANEELGLFFPFPLSDDSQAQQNLSDLQLIRVAFPKYVERPLLYDQAIVYANGRSHPLEIAEDINAISFQVLHQRMLREFSKLLLRVALKKVAEYQFRKQNDVLGAILGIANFATEQADTRNWQTIPHSIYYTRLKLPPGVHQARFQAYTSQMPHIKHHQDFSVDIYPQQTLFRTVNSLAYASN